MPESSDLEGWRKHKAEFEQMVLANADESIKRFDLEVTEKTFGGVKALEITPPNWVDNGKLAVYVHGGGYTYFTARSAMTVPALFSAGTAMRTISIDYTTAPEGQWQQATDEVITVFKALKAESVSLKNVVIYGDSSGGGLAAGAVLKMREQGLEMPGAVILWSPWSDITETGDTYFTLKDVEPLLVYKDGLKKMADAYAKPEDQKNPYVSPVYGDYSKGFPPTLIQVGTREIFLSNAVRLYQAIETANGIAKLDVYEGMPHVFQIFLVDSPETKLAMKRVNKFLEQYLLETGKR